MLWREVGKKEILAQRRCCTCGCYSRYTTLAIYDALAVLGENWFVASGWVTLDACLAGVVDDLERAHDGCWFFVPSLQVLGFADEVGRLHLGAVESGLDWVVFAF